MCSSTARRQRPDPQRPQLGAPRQRSARGCGQSGLSLKCALTARAGAQAAARPSRAAPPPAHTLTAARAPQTAHTQSTRACARRRDSESRAARTPVSAARGRVATEPTGPRRAPHTTAPKRSHPRPTHARDSESPRNRRPQALCATGPVPRLRGRRRHPRHQAQRQEGGDRSTRSRRRIKLRYGLTQVHQAENVPSERK